MKLLIRSLLSIVLLGATLVPVTAQNGRVAALSEQLALLAHQQAEDDYRAFQRKPRRSRPDADAIVQSQQFAAGADFLDRLVHDGAPQPEIQNVFESLAAQSRTVARKFGNGRWAEIDRTIADLRRELGPQRPVATRPGANPGSRNPGTTTPPDDGWGTPPDTGPVTPVPTNPTETTGVLRWRGRVDDTFRLEWRGGAVFTRTVAGQDYPANDFRYSAPLPAFPVALSLVKRRGRGAVTVVQQPDANNGYAAVIEIRDRDRGADEYEFELTWTLTGGNP